MIRRLKGMLALVALAASGLALRWTTAGSIAAANSHDLDSLTVLAVGTVAWIAYGWLLLAVVTTALEQLPGALGTLATAVASHITPQTSRTLLRSALGVAAVTPLTVTTAHAAPPSTHDVAPPHPTWRATEPASTIRLTGPTPTSGAASSNTPDSTTWRATEPQSKVRITGPASTTRGSQDGPGARPQDGQGARQQEILPGEPQQTGSPSGTRRSTDRTGRATGRADESTGRTGASTERTHESTERTGGSTARSTPGTPTGTPDAGRVRVGVPDRPTAGAATRYTDLKSGQPIRVPARVVVKPGDTLWSIAATELGPEASTEAIAARWPAWYAANRELIGADPDLILPGQVLRIPASATGLPVPPTHQEK